jgi:hypothetical protein
VPCRRPRAKDIRGTTPGGEAIGIDCASAYEVAYYGGEDEDVTIAARNSTAIHFHLEKIMEVTQRLQPVQDEACTLFEEIKGQGS